MGWKEYEKRKARQRRGKHVGGPGKPDYLRGKIRGEIKNWSRPLSKGDVMREARKGRDEITSKLGFLQSAIDYAKRYRPNLKLIHRNKVVKKRKKQ